MVSRAGEAPRSAGDESRVARFGKRLQQSLEIAGASGRRNLPMEGLRGFSISLVFLVHYSLALAPWVPVSSRTFQVMRAFSGIGNAGVDLFFLLSGYLIYGTLIRRRQPIGRYVVRRVRRIYPTFLVVLFIYVALSLVAPSFSKLPSGLTDRAMVIVENVLLLPGLVQVAPVVGVAWSLSYEMFFYLVLPLVIGVFALRTKSRGYRIAAFLVVFALIIGNALAFHGLHVRMIMFVAGILLHETMESGVFARLHGRRIDAVAAAIVASAFIAVWWLRDTRTATGLLAAPAGLDPHGEILEALALFAGFFTLCHAAFALPATGPIAQLFSWTPLRLLGNMSYSYYLVHNLVLRVLFVAVAMVHHPAANETVFFWLCLPFAFVITLLPAFLLFLSVERPASLARSAPDVHALDSSKPSVTYA